MEYRAVNEVRTVEDEKQMIIEGVVNNIGQWSKLIGGQFREKINEGTFERAINRALENGDIFFLHQHDNRALPLASIKSNTLELIEDKENNQLKMRAVLPETSFSRDIYELVKSGVLREFSFGFNKSKSKWKIGKDGIKERSLVDFDIHEISIVRVGAYNQTQAYARAFEEIEERFEKEDSSISYKFNKNKINLIKNGIIYKKIVRCSMDIEQFCEKIKVKYCIFLYEYTQDEWKRLMFPFCCHLSANLISSYLKVHYSEDVKHMRQIKVNYPHSWTEVDNKVIDFTYIQKVLDDDTREKFKNYSVSRKELEKMITEQKVVFKIEEHRDTNVDWPYREKQENLSEEYALKIKNDPFNEESFMEYVRLAIDAVNNQTEY